MNIQTGAFCAEALLQTPTNVSRPRAFGNAAAESQSNALTSLFHESWWLDAATGGDWQEATVQENGQVVARLPYVVKRSGGLTGLCMPPLTRTLGPQFAARRDGSPTDHRRLVAELVAQLPRHDYFKQICDPKIGHTLPFYAQGFDSTVSFSLRIPAGQSPEATRMAQRKQLRYDVTKAARSFSVDSKLSIDEFCSLHNQWVKANHNVWWSRSFEQRADAVKLRLYEACAARNCIIILGARDAQSVVRATIVLVWGHGVMYYWLSGRDPDPMAAGATKLLIANAIDLAGSKNLSFDFDGFPRPSAVSMLTGFGGEVVNRITVSKSSLMATLAKGISSRLKFGI